MKVLIIYSLRFWLIFKFSISIDVKCDAQTGCLNAPHPYYSIDTVCADYSRKVINFVPVSTYFSSQSPGSPNYPSQNDLLKSVHTINKLYNESGLFFHLPIMEDNISFIGGSIQTRMDNHISNHPFRNSIFGFYLNGTEASNGYAYCIPSNYFTLYFNSALGGHLNGVAAHEMGHCLGLFHTYNDFNDSQELADFTECNLRGDYLCDTPADNVGLSSYVDSECNFSQPSDTLAQLKDEANEPLSPDPENIMSYSHHECLLYFSPLQAKAMHCAIRKDTTLFPIQRSIELKIEDIIIDSIAVWTGNKDIRGNIFVSENGDLTIEDTIKMPFFASMIIAPGGKLTLNGAHITSYTTGQFWQGIIVEGAGQTSGNGWLVLDGATLEHTRLAVYSENGGRVNAENSTFNNNKKSIYISQYRRLLPNRITNCTFITDEELFDVAWHVPLWDSTVLELNGSQNNHPDHDYFVQVESSNLITITGSDFISTASLDDNRYGTGVTLIDADVTISGCHFENQRFGISKHNTFPGGRGITSIKNNTFDECRWSILLGGGDFTRIVGNTFRIPQDIDTAQIAAGIVNDGSNAVQIKDGNSFGASDANNSFFIYSNKLVDQHASEITRNTFGRADSSSWRQVELHGAQESLQIFCNEFRLSGGSDFAVGLEKETTLMDQGTSDIPAGNDWNTLDSCSESNDESHIYSDGDNDAFGYVGFSDKVPDCISHNVNATGLFIPQPGAFCDEPILCPTPSIPCWTEAVDSTLLVIDSLLYRPPIGMSQADIDRNLGYAHHSKNIKIQDVLIHYFEVDSIELVLEWLDTISQRVEEFDSLHLLIQIRYADLLLRPQPFSSNLKVSSLKIKAAITSSAGSFRDLFPLTKKDNQPNIKSQLEEGDDNKIYKFWPNPSNNSFQVKWLNQYDNHGWNILVSDLNGKIFLKESYYVHEMKSFSVQNWPSGIYLVRIFFGGKFISTEKLIVIH